MTSSSEKKWDLNLATKFQRLVIFGCHPYIQKLQTLIIHLKVKNTPSNEELQNKNTLDRHYSSPSLSFRTRAYALKNEVQCSKFGNKNS